MTIINEDLSDSVIGRIRVKERDSITSWMSEGSCNEMAIEAEEYYGMEGKRAVINLFYPTRHEGPEDVARAKAVCFQCPVRSECLTYSILNYEKVGIWGGLGEKERRVLRRQMKAAKVLNKKDALGWVRANRHKIGRRPKFLSQTG